MKLYVHTGKGHCIGSHAIAWAGSKKTAEKLIREALDSGGLKGEPLDVVCVGALESPMLIYFDNGDY